MRGAFSLTSLTATLSLLLGIQLAGCERSQSQGPQSAPAAQVTSRFGAPDANAHGGGNSREPWSYQDWPTGPYKVVDNWPKPLPDTRHSHDGWTWGSFGSVYAESPDRIWIAMRGELPLPAGAAPWTPYVALNPPRTANGNSDGVTATCGEEPKRGWERRFEHSIFVVNRTGELVDEWPELDKLFSATPCGRGPHQIKISPYDPEKHVWIIDDQHHMIYRFTHDGKLDMKKGELGVAGRGPNNFNRPTDIAWLPDGTYFITDGYGGTRVAKFDKNDNFVKDWGEAPKDPQHPGPNEFNTVHSIAISKDGRLFVVDRGHERMQVFDTDGKFITMWSLRSPHWPASQAHARDESLHRRQGLHLGRRRRHESNPKIRPRRQLLVRVGCTRPAAGTLELSARAHDRPARQSLHRRLLRGTRAEVRADRGRGPEQASGTAAAHLGHVHEEAVAARRVSFCP